MDDRTFWMAVGVTIAVYVAVIVTLDITEMICEWIFL